MHIHNDNVADETSLARRYFEWVREVLDRDREIGKAIDEKRHWKTATTTTKKRE